MLKRRDYVIVLLCYGWFYLLALLSLLVPWCSLTIFDVFLTADLWFVDLPNRLANNDSLVNLFNFFWTSTTYLTGLFATLLLTLTLRYFFNSSKWAYLILFSAIVGSFSECFDFISFNSMVSNSLTSSEVNALLSNSLNKYHPLILYFSSFLCLLNFLLLSQVGTTPMRYNLNKWFLKFRHLNYLTFTINFSALAVGSWWALQEGTWGGWWNWDASEVLGLLVLLSTLWVIHSRWTLLNFIKGSELGFLILSGVLLSYYMLQLNFELTSHSFGSRFTYFFNNNLFLLEVFTVLCVHALFQIGHKRQLRTRLLAGLTDSPLRLCTSSTSRAAIIWFGVFVGVILLISSFLPLLNYFFWRYLKVNSFNSYILIEFWVYFISFSLTLLSLAQLTGVGLILLLTLTFQLDFLILLLLSVRVLWGRLQLFHILTFSFLVVNIWSYQFQLVWWVNPSPTFNLGSGCASLSNSHTNYTCSNYFIDRTVFSTNSSYNFVSYVNFFYKSHADQLNNFFLYCDNTIVGSLFYNSIAWQSSAIYIELLSLPNLADLLFGWLLFLGYFSYRPLNVFFPRF